MSTPVVFHARTGPEADRLVKDANAVPSVTREFRRTDRIVVRVQAYGPGTEIPDVTARVLNRAGNALEDLPFTPQPVTGLVNVQVPLANLAPGEYLVEKWDTSSGLPHNTVRAITQGTAKCVAGACEIATCNNGFDDCNNKG